MKKKLVQISLFSAAVLVLAGCPPAVGDGGGDPGLDADGTGDPGVEMDTDLAESSPILRASDAQPFDDFGFSVGIGDGYAIVGAPNEDTGGATSGAAYLFERDGSSWSEAAILKASNPGADDEFGWSVAIDGTVAVVGAPGEDGELDAGPIAAGAAYVFERTASGWDEVAILRASDAAPGDQFGFSVAVSGDVLVVGAPLEDGGGADLTQAGAAYVFRRGGSGWDEEAILRAADLQEFAEFGYSVGISGDYAIAGAPYRDASDFDEGAAYLFEYDGSGWNQEPRLEASDAQQSDQFGYSVSISGANAIVGAHFEDGGTGDPLSAAGAAYAFSRGPSGWSEADILRASDAAPMNYFGRAVSVYGDFAVVGAHGPASFAGAAYFFSRDGFTWTAESILDASDAAADDVFGWSVAIGPDAAVFGAPENEEGAAYVFE